MIIGYDDDCEDDYHEKIHERKNINPSFTDLQKRCHYDAPPHHDHDDQNDRDPHHDDDWVIVILVRGWPTSKTDQWWSPIRPARHTHAHTWPS